MAEYIDLDAKVYATFYDEQYEEWSLKSSTVRNVLSAVCDDLPPAANVRENVKWEWDMDSVAFYRKCPNCKCCVRDNRYEVFLDNGDLHFCPNCGADMRGENDG